MAKYNSALEAFSQYHIDQEEHGVRLPVGPALPAFGHAVSGSVGSAISHLITYPLDLVVTRLQVQRQLANEIGEDSEKVEYKDVLDAVQKIYAREGGVKAFYSGVWHDAGKSVADSFFFFLAYSFLRESRQQRKGMRKLPVVEELAIGMLAGAFSKFLTTPVQQVVTRKQTAAMAAVRSHTPSIAPDLSTRDMLLQIRDEKGILGFWSGYSASLILTLNPAITMMLHETFLRILIPRARRQNPGAKTTFLLAALSKAVASTITYPVSLAKTRAQMSSAILTTSGPHVSPEKGDIASATSNSAEKAKRNTIIHSILRVVQTEGVAALYQGVLAEVLKGFFQHGITMLVKQRVHSFVIQLYYVVLKVLQKYPSPEELAHSANEGIVSARAAAGEKTDQLVAGAKAAAQGSAARAEELAQSGVAKGEGLLQSARHSIAERLQRTRELAGEALEKAEKVFTDDDSVPAGDVYGKDFDADENAVPKGKK